MVRLLSHHISDPCLEILTTFKNFVCLPERGDTEGGKDNLRSVQIRSYHRKVWWILSKTGSPTDATRKTCLHLKREPTQTVDSWVVTVKERVAECKFNFFSTDFYEQAVRDKPTFSCKEDSYKRKLTETLWPGNHIGISEIHPQMQTDNMRYTRWRLLILESRSCNYDDWWRKVRAI